MEDKQTQERALASLAKLNKQQREDLAEALRDLSQALQDAPVNYDTLYGFAAAGALLIDAFGLQDAATLAEQSILRADSNGN